MIVKFVRLVAVSVTGVIGLAAQSFAEPPNSIMQQSGGWYVWADGSYQSVKLPSYDLGFKTYQLPGNAPGAPFDTYDPRANGWGIAGAVGYKVPWGPGRTLRFEIGGSYVEAEASQTAANSIAGGLTAGYFVQLLNGRVQTNQSCIGAAGCRTASSLQTDYRSWNINGKAAADYQFGATTVSPSLAVFGGRTSNDQNLVQNLIDTAASATRPDAIYSANSTLRWTDVGVRVGLDVQHAVSTWLTLGVGGAVGVAYRDADLNASDFCENGFIPICTLFVATAPASSITTSVTKTPFLASAEASVVARPWTPNVALRGFAGLRYDSDVPGIATPGQPARALAGSSGTPAGIKFQSELSWYAGGGLVVTFAP